MEQVKDRFIRNLDEGLYRRVAGRAAEMDINIGDAINEINRAYTTLEMSYNRRLAGKQQLAAVQAAFEADNAPLMLVLEAQRQLADAETHYFRCLVEYAARGRGPANARAPCVGRPSRRRICPCTWRRIRPVPGWGYGWPESRDRQRRACRP